MLHQGLFHPIGLGDFVASIAAKTQAKLQACELEFGVIARLNIFVFLMCGVGNSAWGADQNGRYLHDVVGNEPLPSPRISSLFGTQP